MRGQDHIVHPEERVVAAGGLLFEDIEPGRRDHALVQGLDQRCFVRRRAAPRGDVDRGLFHLPEMLFSDHPLGTLGRRRMHREDVGARQEFRQAHGLDAALDHDDLFDKGVIGDDIEAERLGALGDGARDMAERNEAQCQPAQPRDLQQHRPPLGPASLAHQPVLLHEAAMRRQDQAHRMIGDLLDKGIRAIGDRDALGGRRRDIDRVDADAAQRDDLAAREPVDHALGDRAALGIERVGVLCRGDEFLLGPGLDLVDLRVDRGERLQFVAVIAAGHRKAGARRRRDPEFGQGGPPNPRNSEGADQTVRGQGCQLP